MYIPFNNDICFKIGYLCEISISYVVLVTSDYYVLFTDTYFSMFSFAILHFLSEMTPLPLVGFLPYEKSTL